MHEQAVIGLIGGMSWESSAEYYRIINREVRSRLGGVHSARSLMWSVDFGEIERLQHQGDWDELTKRMKDAAIRLERGGADFVLLCTNTMHLMADAVGAIIDPRCAVEPPAVETAAHVRVLESVVAHGRRGAQPPALTLLALLAWWQGDGARARLLLERALSEDPAYTLAQLLDATLAAAVPPGWISRPQ